MKLHLITVAAASLLLATGHAAPRPVGPLEGIWGVVSLEIDGQPVDLNGLRSAQLMVAGDSYSFRLGETRLEMTHKVNPARRPATLDMTVTEGPMKGKTYHAIYELTNGELKICRNVEPDQDRPAEFGSWPGSGLMVIVWRRDTP